MIWYSIFFYHFSIDKTTYNLMFFKLSYYNLQKSSYKWHELSELELSDWEPNP